MSAELFGRGLFLPVGAWIHDHPRQRPVYFSDVRDGLAADRLQLSESQLSLELGRLEELGMLQRGAREGRHVPYRVLDHELWRLINIAKQLGWRPPGRSNRRAG